MRVLEAAGKRADQRAVSLARCQADDSEQLQQPCQRQGRVGQTHSRCRHTLTTWGDMGMSVCKPACT